MFFQPPPPPPADTVAPLVVQPARLPDAASEQAFSVIRLEEDRLGGVQRLDQALAQAPGVDLFRRTDSLSSNPTTQGISLRSIAPSGAGRALVTLDGVPQNDPFGGWVIWAGIPAELLESVSILRGGGSGPYGAGALTGVIELDERTDHGLVANARAGELGSSRGAVVDSFAVGGFDLLVGGSLETTDGFVPVRHNPGAGDTPTFLDSWSVNARATTDLAGGRLAFHVGAYDDDRGSGQLGANARAQGTHASITYARNPSADHLGYRLQAWVRDSDLYNSSATVSANRTTATVTNIQYETPATGYGLNAALRTGGKDRQFEVGVDGRHTQGETHELFSLTASGGPFNRRAGGDTLIYGAYAEATQKSGPWLLTGGVRYDWWSNTNALRIETNHAGAVTLNSSAPDHEGSLPTARVGARHEMDWGYVRAAAYTGFRAPTLNELHRPFRVGAITTLANPNLEPEKLAGGEIGAGGAGETTSWDVTVFYNELTDPITNVTRDATTRERRNADPIRATGIEADGSWKVSSDLTVRAAVAYTNAGTIAQTLTVPIHVRPAQTARVAATASVEWQATDKLGLEGRLRYDGDRYDDDLNTLLLHAGTVVDLRASWRFNDEVVGFVAADNAFDEALENGQTTLEYNYAAPRIVSLGIEYRR